MLVGRPHRRVEVLHPTPQGLAPAGEIQVVDGSLVVESCQPVDAVDRSVGDATARASLRGSPVDARRQRQRRHAQARPARATSRVADAALVQHDDDARRRRGAIARLRRQRSTGGRSTGNGHAPRVSARRLGLRRRPVPARCGSFGDRFGTRSGSGLGRDPADDVVEGREVAQLEGVVAVDAELRPDRGEHLGLLDGVDAEVGFEVEVEVEQLGRVAGHARPRSPTTPRRASDLRRRRRGRRVPLPVAARGRCGWRCCGGVGGAGSGLGRGPSR